MHRYDRQEVYNEIRLSEFNQFLIIGEKHSKEKRTPIQSIPFDAEILIDDGASVVSSKSAQY